MHFSRRVALVTEATPDYNSGDLCGGKITFANVVRHQNGAGLLKRLNLLSIDSIGVDGVFLIFRSNPSKSTFTENAAFSIHADDLPNLLRAVLVPSDAWETLTGTSYYEAEIALNIPFQVDGDDLYGAFIAGGTINLSSAASIIATLAGEVDR